MKELKESNGEERDDPEETPPYIEILAEFHSWRVGDKRTIGGDKGSGVGRKGRRAMEKKS